MQIKKGRHKCGRSRRPKEASRKDEKNRACHDSLQQMWTSATNDTDLMHAHKSTATFLSFPLTLSLLPQLLASLLSLSLSLSFACSTCRALQDKWCMPLSLHGYDNIKTLHAMMAGWRRTVRKRDYLGWGTMPPRIHDGQPGYTVCFLYTALLFCLGESLSSPPLWSPRPCS